MDKFIVSARKYRPQNFNTVIGQSHITTTLKNAIKNNHLAHAFLFCGPRGVGKTTCARILAKTINCEELSADGEACNKCTSCKTFNEGISLNIFELDAASNNSVDDIRTLVEQIRFSPQGGKYKVYIVDEVHMLTQSAFNAFLKTLEEPPPYAIFILATTEKHKILPTILSRCQIFDFKRITTKDTVEHLEEICDKEHIKADKAALHVIAQKSEGCLRDALSILDKIVSFTNGKLDYANTLEHLNILDEDYYFQLLDHINNQALPEALLLFDEINQKGFEGDTFIDGLAEFIRNLMVSKDAKALALLEVASEFKAKYTESAAKLSTGWLIGALHLISECSIQYKQARNKRLQIEVTLIKLTYLQQAIELMEEDEQVVKKKITTETTLRFRALPIIALPAKASRQLVTQEPILKIEKEKTQDALPTTTRVQMPVSNTVNEIPTASIGSLHKIRQQISHQNQQTTSTNELDSVSLLSSWEAYIQQLETRKNHSAVTNFRLCELKIIDKNCIEIVVATAFQQKFIDAERTALLEHLQKTFSNKFLTYQVSIEEKETNEIVEEKQLSRKQQFVILTEKYPLVKELKDRLRLHLT